MRVSKCNIHLTYATNGNECTFKSNLIVKDLILNPDLLQMKSKINEFDSLVSKALDSNISDSEAVHLKELLSNNKNLQRRYCSFVRNESLMHWEQSFQAVETENKLFQIKAGGETKSKV